MNLRFLQDSGRCFSFFAAILVFAGAFLSGCAEEIEARYAPCFSISELNSNDNSSLLKLTPITQGLDRPTCKQIFNVLSNGSRPEDKPEILSISYAVDIGDIYTERSKCGLKTDHQSSYFKWDVSELLNICENSPLVNSLGNSDLFETSIGKFIPSNYNQKDKAIFYWYRNENKFGPMMAGILENPLGHPIPICMHFRMGGETGLSASGVLADDVVLMDEIEACLSRFVNTL